MAEYVTIKMHDKATFNAAISALPKTNILSRLANVDKIYIKDLGLRNLNNPALLAGQSMYMEYWDGISPPVNMEDLLSGDLTAISANKGRIRFLLSDEVQHSVKVGFIKKFIDYGLFELEGYSSDIGGGGSAPASQIIFAPSKAVLKPGEYATWPEVMTAFADTVGLVTIIFDPDGVPIGVSGFPEVLIPLGTYDFEGRTTFSGYWTPNPNVLVTVVDGTKFERVSAIINSVGFYSRGNTVPMFTIHADQLMSIERNAAIASDVGSVEVVNVETGGIIAAAYGGSIMNLGAPSVRVGPGQIGAFALAFAAQLNPDSISGDATAFVVLLAISPASTIDLTQTNILGGSTVIYNTLASLLGFDPSAAGNQLVGITAQAAIDELTNKHVNARSTTYSTAATHTISALDPKLILVDASGIGAGIMNIDLPDPAVDSGPWKIKRIDANGAATVNIRGTAGALVDGAASQTIAVFPGAANIETDGTNWWRI